MKKIIGLFLASVMFTLISTTAYASDFQAIIDSSDLLTSDEETYFQKRIDEILTQYDCHITLVVQEFNTSDEMYSYIANFDDYDKHKHGIVYMVFAVDDAFDFQAFGRWKYQDIGEDTLWQLMESLDLAVAISDKDEVYAEIFEGALNIFENYIEEMYTPPSPPPEEFVGIGGMIDGFDPMLDAADVLTAAQEEQLFTKIDHINQNYNFDVTLMTMIGVPNEEYLLYYFDWYKGLDPTRNGVVFGIDLDPDRRDYATSTRNLGIDVFSEDALDLIDYNVAPLLTEGRYFDAYNLFLDSTILFLDSYNEGKPYKIPIDTESLIIFVFAVPFVFAFAVGSIIMKRVFVAQMTTAVTAVHAERYMVANSLALTNATDVFTHTTETRTKIQSSSSSSDGGSTRSGYGGSRGGRSGKF